MARLRQRESIGADISQSGTRRDAKLLDSATNAAILIRYISQVDPHAQQ